MKKFTLLLTFCAAIFISASTQVTFIIDSIPDYTPPEDIIYIAGDFQGWDPGNPEYALSKNEDGLWFFATDSVPEGTSIAFKFTRGDWTKVEKGPNGEEIPNREFTFGNGETVHYVVDNWADFGGGGSHTAADNVHIMDSAFYMPQFDRERRIWVYLPPDYEETEDFYPVIYMHDGQNLFDAFTSYVGEWEVDETLNDLFEDGYFVPIVVGIDNGGAERANEYTPWINPNYGGGQGSLYLEFIVETLKPYIDENYRTKPGRLSTAIWGSSLGGLISQYGIMEYQEVFSKAGIYSPSYWWSDTVWTFTSEAGIQEDMKLYQMTGGLEGDVMVGYTWVMDELLKDLGLGENELSTKIVEGGEHNELLWSEDFDEAYLWLFHSFANSVTEKHIQNLTVVPNPVNQSITIPMDIQKDWAYVIFDLSGRRILDGKISTNNLKVGNLNPGFYILELISTDSIYKGKFIKN